MRAILLTLNAMLFTVVLVGTALGVAWVLEAASPMPVPFQVGAFLYRWFPRIVIPTLIALGWWAIR